MLSFLLSFLIICTLVFAGHGQENINTFFFGYDLMYGNPRPTTSSRSDPGQRSAIFQTEVDNISVGNCQGSCSLSFESQVFSGMYSYQRALSGLVTVEAGGFGASFSASTSYKTAAENAGNGSSVFTTTEAQCCQYTARLKIYELPPLTIDFLNGVDSLPATMNSTEAKAAYSQFINSFGTHFLTSAVMGSVYGQVGQMTRAGYSSLESKNISVKAAAGYKGKIASASGSVEGSKEREDAQQLSMASTSFKVVTLGSPPPVGYSDAKSAVEAWTSEAALSPQPLSFSLKPLDWLFLNAEELKSREGIIAKRENLRAALDQYCQHLLAKGVVQTCREPEPGQSLPVPCPRAVVGGSMLCSDAPLRKPWLTKTDSQWGLIPTKGSVTVAATQSLTYSYGFSNCNIYIGFGSSGFKIVGATSARYLSVNTDDSPVATNLTWGRMGSVSQQWANTTVHYSSRPDGKPVNPPFSMLFTLQMEPLAADACSADGSSGYLVGGEIMAKAPFGPSTAHREGGWGERTNNKQLMAVTQCYSKFYGWAPCWNYFFFSE